MHALLERGPDPAGPAASEKPISTGQITAFWGKAGELARYEHLDKKELKERLLGEVAARVKRPLTSLKHLSYREANELLDEMQRDIVSHKRAIAAAGAPPLSVPELEGA